MPDDGRFAAMIPLDKAPAANVTTIVLIDRPALAAGGYRCVMNPARAPTSNVLNRANVGAARGVIRPLTGQAVGFTERLFPRLMTAGLRVEF